MPRTYPKLLQIPPTCIATSHMFYLNGLKTAPKHSKGPFWAFRASKTAASRTHRRPKQAQNASNTPESASDTTYTHCYQSHVVPKWPQNRSKPLYGTIWHILGLSGRVIWPLSGPVKAITASKCPKHTQKCSRYHQRASLPVTCCIHTARKSLKIAQNHYMALYGTFWAFPDE